MIMRILYYFDLLPLRFHGEAKGHPHDTIA